LIIWKARPAGFRWTISWTRVVAEVRATTTL
jgi:hypothetical protein